MKIQVMFGTGIKEEGDVVICLMIVTSWSVCQVLGLGYTSEPTC